ncbi:hypothetical protein ABPG75_004745 [Micractinium tetrahymenae]
MASSPPWFGWLGGLVSGLVSSPPAPGTHEATLEELRVGALLNKEALKPAEQRDEERVHKLRVEYRQRQLANTQARVVHCATNAALAEMPATRQCCAARAWVRQRAAASYRAQHDFYSQLSQQITEELAAAEAWRPAGIVAQPTLRLDLPGALQQPPPRVDMCSGCAGWIQELELAEQSRRVHAEALVGGSGSAMLRHWVQHSCAFDEDLAWTLRLHLAPILVTACVYLSAVRSAGQPQLLGAVVRAAAGASALLHWLSFVRLDGATWPHALAAALFGLVCGPALWSTLSLLAWRAVQACIPASLLAYLTTLWTQGLFADAYAGLQNVRREDLAAFAVCAILGNAAIEIFLWKFLGRGGR